MRRPEPRAKRLKTWCPAHFEAKSTKARLSRSVARTAHRRTCAWGKGPTLTSAVRKPRSQLEFTMEKLLGLPVLASEHGRSLDDLIIYVHWLMIVLFIGWLGYFAYALLRFRRSRNPKANYYGTRSHF